MMAASKLEIYQGDQLHSVIAFERSLTIAQADEFAAGYIEAGYRTVWRPLCLRDAEPKPIDLSWVTTEPVYEGPKWLHWIKLVASIGLMCMLCAIAIAVVVKA